MEVVMVGLFYISLAAILLPKCLCQAFVPSCPPAEATMTAADGKGIIEVSVSDSSSVQVSWTIGYSVQIVAAFTRCFPSGIGVDGCQSGNLFPITFGLSGGGGNITSTNPPPKLINVQYDAIVRYDPLVRAQCEFYLSVLDTGKPVLECPTSVEIPGDEQGFTMGTADWIVPVPTDNSNAQITLTAMTSSGNIVTTPHAFAIGTHEITYTATDQSGNFASCSFNVNITDAEAPQYQDCPTDLVTCTMTDQATASVSFFLPNFTDNSPDPPKVECFIVGSEVPLNNVGEMVPIGTHNIRCNASDAAQNVNSSCQFVITVEDKEEPNITCSGNVTLGTDSRQNFTTFVFSEPDGMTENSLVYTITIDVGDDNLYQINDSYKFQLRDTPHQVHYTITDGSGNTDTCDIFITIMDKEPPELTCPANVANHTLPGGPTGIGDWSAIMPIDNSMQVTIQESMSSGSEFPIGNTTVFVNATDDSGNMEMCNFTVTITGPCANVQCLNGGVCQVQGTTLFCQCQTAFTGQFCQTAPSPCANVQCLNGGVCQVLGTTFFCQCQIAFIGQFCQTAPNPCANVECFNGGVCQVQDTTFFCQCQSGFTGQFCQTAPREVPPNNVATIAVISILSTLVVVLAAGIITFVWRSKMNRESRSMQAAGSTVEMVPKTQTPTEYARTIDTSERAEAFVYEDVGLPSWAVRWKIVRSDLDVDDTVLGRGNFGEVRSGTVDQGGQRTKCAIKILKGLASPSDRQDFLEEFRIMTRIGYHPNVVSLIGACQHQDVLYVALEYLPHGDLRNHLRSSRPDSDSEPSLTSEQLIKFALDVAMGMEHLESSTVIHRDLAARNILLGRGFVAKVSDFGLSRGEDIYVQTSMRRVPTRWLSIESILHKTYTTKSDVWSFGILLWEIATLGGTPYPSIKTKDLASQLIDGYRMSKPPNCDEKIYKLMIRCWNENPTNRPSFSDLVAALSEMNESQINHIYLDLIMRPHYENFSVIRPELDDN